MIEPAEPEVAAKEFNDFKRAALIYYRRLKDLEATIYVRKLIEEFERKTGKKLCN